MRLNSPRRLLALFGVYHLLAFEASALIAVGEFASSRGFGTVEVAGDIVYVVDVQGLVVLDVGHRQKKLRFPNVREVSVLSNRRSGRGGNR
jgi:hypothetical protein